jgi:hypothetical protein
MGVSLSDEVMGVLQLGVGLVFTAKLSRGAVAGEGSHLRPENITEYIRMRLKRANGVAERHSWSQRRRRGFRSHRARRQ